MSAANDPGKRYAGRVAPEFTAAMAAVVLSVSYILRPHKATFEQLDEAERQSHSHLHITDPTLYRDQINSAQFDQNVRMMRAALRFVREVEGIAKEAGIVLPELCEVTT